jgi:hypothetical protein
MDTTVPYPWASEKKRAGKIETHCPGVGLQDRKIGLEPMDRIAAEERNIDGIA